MHFVASKCHRISDRDKKKESVTVKVKLGSNFDLSDTDIGSGIEGEKLQRELLSHRTLLSSSEHVNLGFI